MGILLNPHWKPSHEPRIESASPISRTFWHAVRAASSQARNDPHGRPLRGEKTENSVMPAGLAIAESTRASGKEKSPFGISEDTLENPYYGTRLLTRLRREALIAQDEATRSHINKWVSHIVAIGEAFNWPESYLRPTTHQPLVQSAAPQRKVSPPIAPPEVSVTLERPSPPDHPKVIPIIASPPHREASIPSSSLPPEKTLYKKPVTLRPTPPARQKGSLIQRVVQDARRLLFDATEAQQSDPKYVHPRVDRLLKLETRLEKVGKRSTVEAVRTRTRAHLQMLRQDSLVPFVTAMANGVQKIDCEVDDGERFRIQYGQARNIADQIRASVGDKDEIIFFVGRSAPNGQAGANFAKFLDGIKDRPDLMAKVMQQSLHGTTGNRVGVDTDELRGGALRSHDIMTYGAKHTHGTTGDQSHQRAIEDGILKMFRGPSGQHALSQTRGTVICDVVWVLSIPRAELQQFVGPKNDIERKDIARYITAKNTLFPTTKLVGQILDDDRYLPNKFYQPGAYVDPTAKQQKELPGPDPKASVWTIPLSQLVIRQQAA